MKGTIMNAACIVCHNELDSLRTHPHFVGVSFWKDFWSELRSLVDLLTRPRSDAAEIVRAFNETATAKSPHTAIQVTLGDWAVTLTYRMKGALNKVVLMRFVVQ